MHFSFIGNDRFDSDVIANYLTNRMDFLEYVVFEDNFILKIFMKLPLTEIDWDTVPTQNFYALVL